jgi:DNA polymerase III epsilon subunit-like protein
MELPFNVIVIDLETSGEPDQRVVEIGAVRLDTRLSDEVQTFEALVDGRPMTDEVTEIHGITPEMLIGKPSFGEIRRTWEAWCELHEPYVLASWSDFDARVLRDEYARIGARYPHSGHMFDVKSLVWWECLKHGFPSRKLPVDRALSILGMPFEGQKHRALPDAMMEAKLFRFVAKNPGTWRLAAV